MPATTIRSVLLSGPLSLLWLSACGGEEEGPVEPSFATDIAPIFASRCNTCHYPGTAIGYELGTPFDPETGIVGRLNSWHPNGSDEALVVDPGNVENSSLITKVRDTDLDLHVDGNAMPYQVERLSADELAAVEQWIRDGANDDASFAQNVAPIFGTEITLRRAAGKCTWCHYPGSPTGMSVLGVFDPDEGMVDVDSFTGGKIIVPGDPDNSILMKRLQGESSGRQMPLHFDRLTAAEVQFLVDWIDDGAPNN